MIVAEFCLVFGICIVELIVCFVMFMLDVGRFGLVFDGGFGW